MPARYDGNDRGVGDDDLDAVAHLPRVLLELRAEAHRQVGDAGDARARSCGARARAAGSPGAPISSNGRVVPRALRDLGGLDQHRARRRRSRRRASACWATAIAIANPARPARAPRAASPSSSITRRPAGSQRRRFASRRTSSPSVRRWRIGRRNALTNDSKPSRRRLPSTRSPPSGLGRSSTHTSTPRGDRRLRRPHRGGGVGVDAVADVLEVDQQKVEPVERAAAAAPATPRSSRRARSSRCRRTRRARARTESCPARPPRSRARERTGGAARRRRWRRARRRSSAAGSRWRPRRERARRSAGRRAARGSRSSRSRPVTITRCAPRRRGDAARSLPLAALAAALGLQAQIGDDRAALHRLHHVVERERGAGARRHRLHLGAGARGDHDAAADRGAVRARPRSSRRRDRAAADARAAPESPVALRRLDAGEPRHHDGVALGQVAQPARRLGIEQHAARRFGDAARHRLWPRRRPSRRVPTRRGA